MEKIIKLCSKLKIIFGIIGLPASFFYSLGVMQSLNPVSEKIISILLPIVFIAYITAATFIGKFRNWARVLSIALDTIIIFLLIFLLIGIAKGLTTNALLFCLFLLGILTWFIIYFTRPKVKEQFK